jgi:hypothetical protein
MENKEQNTRWPDSVRLKMIEKSKFYDRPDIYQYGYYDGYQNRNKQSSQPINSELTQLRAENERLKEDNDYWKLRCQLAEDCLEKSPCDPDITSEQIDAWKAYHEFIKQFGGKLYH